MNTPAPQWRQLIGSSPEQICNYLGQLSAEARANLWTETKQSVLFGEQSAEEDDLLDELVDQLGPGSQWEGS